MKLMKIAKREYLGRVKKKSFLIGTILGPVLMAAMIFAPALMFRHGGERQTKMAVVDGSGSIYEELDAALTDGHVAGQRPVSTRAGVRGGGVVAAAEHHQHAQDQANRTHLSPLLADCRAHCSQSKPACVVVVSNS